MGYWDRNSECYRDGERDYDRYRHPDYARSRYSDSDACYFRGYDDAEREHRHRQEEREEAEAAELRAERRRAEERAIEQAYEAEYAYDEPYPEPQYAAPEPDSQKSATESEEPF